MSRGKECIACDGLGKPYTACSPDDDICMMTWKVLCEAGDHRRCLDFDIKGCDTKASLPRVLDAGLSLVRESGEEK